MSRVYTQDVNCDEEIESRHLATRFLYLGSDSTKELWMKPRRCWFLKYDRYNMKIKVVSSARRLVVGVYETKTAGVTRTPLHENAVRLLHAKGEGEGEARGESTTHTLPDQARDRERKASSQPQIDAHMRRIHHAGSTSPKSGGHQGSRTSFSKQDV